MRILNFEAVRCELDAMKHGKGGYSLLCIFMFLKDIVHYRRIILDQGLKIQRSE